MTRISNSRISALFRAGPISATWAAAACTGKEAFDTPQLAAKVAAKRKRNGDHYRCRICGKYHIGGNGKRRAE